MSRTRLRRKYRFERYQPLTQQTPLMHCRPPGHIPLLQKLVIFCEFLLNSFQMLTWIPTCWTYISMPVIVVIVPEISSVASSPARFNATPSHVAIISSRTAPTRTMLNWITVVRTAD
ncbi:hypothetical protein T05_1226 [Trichinella murrelli]|uniref:Uncharacterized protein n=1 Tax=Trichinella murrelli TaxID=144512 RepID=A0A0V0TEU4_9BILA|nr:hypothetical protein T05_1226 [Trichinella murrelli]